MASSCRAFIVCVVDLPYSAHAEHFQAAQGERMRNQCAIRSDRRRERAGDDTHEQHGRRLVLARSERHRSQALDMFRRIRCRSSRRMVGC
jgi:hypothetical protein